MTAYGWFPIDSRYQFATFNFKIPMDQCYQALFYLLFGYPTNNFGPLFGSLVTRLGCYAWPSIYFGLNEEISNAYPNKPLFLILKDQWPREKRLLLTLKPMTNLQVTEVM